jgi:hypothetical protein
MSEARRCHSRIYVVPIDFVTESRTTSGHWCVDRLVVLIASIVSANRAAAWFSNSAWPNTGKEQQASVLAHVKMDLERATKNP